MTTSTTVHLELDRADADLVIKALHSYLSDFGHEQADLLHSIKRVTQQIERTVGPATDFPSTT